MWVFPGGRVDTADADPSAPGDELAAAACCAASREALEEAGLQPHRGVRPLRPLVAAPDRAGPRRFSTWFFAVRSLSGDVVVDGGEIHEHAWLTPAVALARHVAGERSSWPRPRGSRSGSWRRTTPSTTRSEAARAREPDTTPRGRWRSTTSRCSPGTATLPTRAASMYRGSPPPLDGRRRLALRTLSVAVAGGEGCDRASGTRPPPMLDHVFTDAITALREAFENALLERQAFEEHFQSDILLGDLTWETSYGLPGEGLPPRVEAHISFDWPTWSQTAYRKWYLDEVLDEAPVIEIEIVFRLQRLVGQPDPSVVLDVLPAQSPPIGAETLERAAPTVEIAYSSEAGEHRVRHRGGLRGPVRAGRGDAGRRLLDRLDEHFGALGGWISSMLVRLGDLKLEYLPPEDEASRSVATVARHERPLHRRRPRPASRCPTGSPSSPSTGPASATPCRAALLDRLGAVLQAAEPQRRGRRDHPHRCRSRVLRRPRPEGARRGAVRPTSGPAAPTGRRGPVPAR